MTMMDFLNDIGLLAFAISGSIIAGKQNMDILGGYVIAFITAIGGGTIRDVLLGVDVAWLSSVSDITIIIVGATIGIFFSKKIIKWNKMLTLFDTIGIAVFTITGVQKGLSYDQLPLIAVVLGMITATFGGLTRDVICNEIPLIFREEVYAIPCLAGGSLYLVGHFFGYSKEAWLLWSCILVIFIFRMLAVKYAWSLPLIRNNKYFKS